MLHILLAYFISKDRGGPLEASHSISDIKRLLLITMLRCDLLDSYCKSQISLVKNNTFSLIEMAF